MAQAEGGVTAAKTGTETRAYPLAKGHVDAQPFDGLCHAARTGLDGMASQKLHDGGGQDRVGAEHADAFDHSRVAVVGEAWPEVRTTASVSRFQTAGPPTALRNRLATR